MQKYKKKVTGKNYKQHSKKNKKAEFDIGYFYIPVSYK
jgi:hypothetical protein